MKGKQRFYESYDLNNLYIRLNDSMVHKRNLDQIRNRKNQFSEIKEFNTISERIGSPKRKGFFDLNYMIEMERDNKILSQKLNKISLKIPSPFQLNEEFIQIEAKNKMFIEKYKKLRENEIKEVNVQLKKRLKEKQSFISAKKLDSEFKDQQSRLINMRKKKIVGTFDSIGKKITLPTIFNSRIPTQPDKRVLTEPQQTESEQKENE